MRRAASVAGPLAHAVLALAVLGACGPAAPAGAAGALPPVEASALLATHRASFERFEAWGRRVASSDATFREPGALEEVAFSPVRRDPTVVAAFVARDGGGALALVHPTGAALEGAPAFTSVASGDGIEVARAEVALGEGTPRPAIALRRARPLGGGATLTVTMAFAPAE